MDIFRNKLIGLYKGIVCSLLAVFKERLITYDSLKNTGVTAFLFLKNNYTEAWRPVPGSNNDLD